MWIWDFQLRQLGFRRKNNRYWRCEYGFGLNEGDHLSLFLWTRETHSATSPTRSLAYELTEFHVTFLTDRDHLHFYYHEIQENRWEPGGYTSAIQIQGLGFDPRDLISEADTIAQELVAVLNGTWVPRNSFPNNSDPPRESEEN